MLRQGKPSTNEFRLVALIQAAKQFDGKLHQVYGRTILCTGDREQFHSALPAILPISAEKTFFQASMRARCSHHMTWNRQLPIQIVRFKILLALSTLQCHKIALPFLIVKTHVNASFYFCFLFVIYCHSFGVLCIFPSFLLFNIKPPSRIQPYWLPLHSLY